MTGRERVPGLVKAEGIPFACTEWGGDWADDGPGVRAVRLRRLEERPPIVPPPVPAGPAPAEGAGR